MVRAESRLRFFFVAPLSFGLFPMRLVLFRTHSVALNFFVCGWFRCRVNGLGFFFVIFLIVELTVKLVDITALPLFARSHVVLQHLRRRTNNKIMIAERSSLAHERWCAATAFKVTCST